MKLRRSKLSHEQTQKILEHFVAGTPARTVAEILQVNKNTALLFYQKIRILIARKLEEDNHLIFREINFVPDNLILDATFLKSTLLTTSNKRKLEQKPLFAVITRQKRIYTFYPLPQISHNFSQLQKPLVPDVIFGHDNETSVINAKDIQLCRTSSESSCSFKEGQRSKIDSIENFWKLTKHHWLKFNGIPLESFFLFLKEAEWRYNYKKPEILLKTLLRWINS